MLAVRGIVRGIKLFSSFPKRIKRKAHQRGEIETEEGARGEGKNDEGERTWVTLVQREFWPGPVTVS